MSEEQLLKIEHKDGVLSLSIGTQTLSKVLEACLPGQRGMPEISIYNVEAFMGDLATELQREEEDGTTLAHRMFDQAAINAYENGAEGIAEV